MFLRAHWALALAIDDRLIPIYPTTHMCGRTRTPVHDGGYTIRLEDLPLERLNVPRFSGLSCRYVPVQYGEYTSYGDSGVHQAIIQRLTRCMDDHSPIPPGMAQHA